MNCIVQNPLLFKKIQRAISNLQPETVLVHTDASKGFFIDDMDCMSTSQLLRSHISLIEELCLGKPIWMPTFNYDFPKTGIYSVNDSPSQVGRINEYFRKNVAHWRSAVPIFSFAGVGKNYPDFLDEEINPFGGKSLFDILAKQKSVLLHYGSWHNTVYHYCEGMSQNLCYRYDKLFSGKVMLANETKEVTLRMHVRPAGVLGLDYDYQRIESELIKCGLWEKFTDERTEISCINLPEMVRFIIAKINNDPFYLLDETSRGWVKPMYENLGRPFLITDFE